MDQELKQWKQAVRRLKCPPAVQDEVSRRLAAEPAPSGWVGARIALGGGAVALAAGVAAVFLHLAPERPPIDAGLSAPRSEQERLAVVADARLAFATFGQALRQAVDRGEPVVLREAVSPLQDRLNDVRNRITEQP